MSKSDFVNKSAESLFFLLFPLVFSRKNPTDGITRNEYRGDIQAELQLDDLYEL